MRRYGDAADLKVRFGRWPVVGTGHQHRGRGDTEGHREEREEIEEIQAANEDVPVI
jgi:hypothetical protein